MHHRPDVINYFVGRFEYDCYLEIGVESGNTFNAVTAKSKSAVDPAFKVDRESLKGLSFEMTSDNFFDCSPDSLFDIVFIDGLHTFEQSLRDFTRAMLRIRSGGLILIDDCCPTDYLASIRDHGLSHRAKTIENAKDRNWMGDVYKTIIFINDFYDQVSFSYIQDTMGIVAVWFSPRKISLISSTGGLLDIINCDYVRFKYEVLPELPVLSLKEIGDAVFSANHSRLSVKNGDP